MTGQGDIIVPDLGHTFLGAPAGLQPTGEVPAGVADPAVASDGAAPDFAFLGLPLCVAYGDEPEAGAGAGAPAAVRAATAPYIGAAGHYDFDLGGPLVPGGGPVPLVDAGDVRLDPGDLAASLAAGTAAVRSIAAAGAVPLVVGGDHSAPPVVMRGLGGAGPIDVLHVDAHLDFRDEVQGVRDGYSSCIRRLRESQHVRTIVQVGLRDVGSAREAEVDAARAAGNILVTAEEVHADGIDAALRYVPDGGRVYVTVDVDGLDPGCAPGTLWPAPGGLWFWQVARLLRGAVARSVLAGMDVCEFAPGRDPQGHTALVAARLFMNAIGAELRRRAAAGQ